MPVDEGLRLDEPEAKRHQPDVAGVEGDYEVPDEDWEFTLPGTATQEAARAARGQKLEAHEAASAVEHEEEEEEYVDDVYGTLLRPELVRDARQLELDWIKSREVYKRVHLKECFERTKKRPISMKWIDTDKGDQERPNYRSRL
eukprot:4646322-Amphidinium_carterae.1